MPHPPGKQCRHESSTVEELILANAVTSTNQQMICTMAMVCKDWNMAVQHQAPPGLLNVNLQLQCGVNEWHPQADAVPSNSMEKISSFSKWLSKHARLVSNLEVTGGRPFTQAGAAWYTTLAAPLFSLALRSAVLATAAQASQRQPIGLQSYSSNILHDSSVLKELPAASLTHLQLAGCSAATLAAALPRLSNLRQLDIAGGVQGQGTSRSSIWAAAGQISTLTSLKLDWVPAEDVTQLPVQLARLELCQLVGGPVDFSHLTRLSSLNISDSANSPGQVLPAGLAELYIESDDGGPGDPSVFEQFNINRLQSLESLAILTSRESPEDLHQLGALPALCSLSLGYSNIEQAIAASPAWASLVQLKDIELFDSCSLTNFMKLLDKLSSVTQLIRLELNIDLVVDEEAEETEVIGVCHGLSRLHQLQELTMWVHKTSQGQLNWAQGDVTHLSTLSKLTKLDLGIVGFAREVINDLVVVRLLLRLKQLQELSVPVQNLAVFPVIGDLSSLRTLKLCNVPAEVQQTGLQELQGLKRLIELRGFDSCSKEALAAF